MDYELKKLSVAQACLSSAHCLIFLLPRTQKQGSSKAQIAGGKPGSGEGAISALLDSAMQAGDFDGSAGQLLQAYGVAGIKAQRVILVGIGAGQAKEIQQGIAAAFAIFKSANKLTGRPQDKASDEAKAQTALVLWHKGPRPEQLQAALYAADAALYRYSATKSKPAAVRFNRVVWAIPAHENASDARALDAIFKESKACVAGVALAREWGNRPANHATPTMLAKAARGLAAASSLIQCEVLGPAQVTRLKMGSFMAVAQGSEEPLRFIVLRYQGAAKSAAPVVLIGKGITFDTGGISIKPAAEMDEMKFDMCGAASVLGVFKTLSLHQPKINVVGLIPSCENMPSGKAIKPGDVVTSMSGQTIEILNTDAEGRLILCDALTYAAQFKPQAIIDIATLTGACVVALGGVRSGLFSSHDDLAQALLSAGEAAQDLAWRMPLDDEYAEGLNTHFADVANVAGRAGGAVTAAKFLQRFAGAYPWAHLDIAGTAWKSGPAKGATGRPVALLMKYLLQRSVATGS